MTTALNTARYLVRLATPNEDEDNDCLCHLRLQKLLYYAQGWHLAATGTPLFPDRIEAWKHGPVVRSVYPVFKEYRLAIPPTQGSEPAELSARDRDFIRSIWERYAEFSATALRNMTHRESPWLEARAGSTRDESRNAEITQETMRAFFFPQLIDTLKQQDPRIDSEKWQASANAIAAGQVQTAKDIRCELHRRRAGTDPG